MDLLYGIISYGITALICIGWIYAFFLLMNTGKWYWELVAVLMTGIVGAVILLAGRWTVRKVIGVWRGGGHSSGYQ